MKYINVTVNGNFAEISTKNAGVQGEGNAASLVITFDTAWSEYSKRIIWRDAHGANPVGILFSSDYLNDDDAYVIPVPSEPLTLPGWCSFTIEGFADTDPNRIMYSVKENMAVLPAEDYYAPAPLTPSEAMQLFAMYNALHLVPGPAGATGPTGPRGLPGAGITILGLYGTIEDLQTAHPTGSAGDAYAVIRPVE